MTVSTAPPNPSIAVDSPADSLLRHVTVEHLAYAVLTLAALIARLIHVGGYPLAPAEATTALRAWQASQGLGPALDAGSPLLFSLQTGTFFLAGASDGLARLWPLLAATLLPWAIFGWRGWVGRREALLAATLVTFSPLVNAFARRSDGAAFVLLGLALALAGWAHLQRSDSRGWTLAAIGAGLVLIGGPASPAALIALTLVVLLSRPDFSSLPKPTLTHLVILLGVIFVGGTAFFTHVSALGLIALSWSEWLAGFSFSPSVWLWGLIRVVLDEPLLVVAGIAGIGWGWRRSVAARTFGLAALLIMLLAVWQGPYAAGTRAVAAPLLSIPAAFLFLRLFRRLDVSQPETLLYTAVFSILIVLAWLSLATYSHDAERQSLILFGVTLVIAIIMTLLFAYFIQRRVILAATTLVLLTFLALFNLATTWGMAFDTTLPRYPALYASASRPSLLTLVDTLGDLSERQRGERWALPIALVTGATRATGNTLAIIGAEDALRWYLRPARNLNVMTSIGLGNAPPLVVAPKEAAAALTERYAGQELAAFTAWNPADSATSSTQQKLTWLLFRTAPWDIPTANIVLWADAQTLTLKENP